MRSPVRPSVRPSVRPPVQIRVYCRVRPHAFPSTRLGTDNCSLGLSCEGREHAFSFDRVFGPADSQEAVFGGVAELVQSALDGFHVSRCQLQQ
jgi:kinesin family protein C1